MSNPDMSNNDMKNTSMKLPSINALYIAFPISILFVLIIITFFNQMRSIGSSFWTIFYLSIPLAATVITAGTNIISQYTTCNTINVGLALLGAIPTFIAIIIGIMISSISYCRIPVASLFGPLFMKKAVDITTANIPTSVNDVKKMSTKECCNPKLNLNKMEDVHPTLLGLSYSFYIMFSVLFGTVIGTNISRIC
jgi:hypothetical protein